MRSTMKTYVIIGVQAVMAGIHNISVCWVFTPDGIVCRNQRFGCSVASIIIVTR
jgi:hypothetical protein